jgi:hypothetical protein
LGREAITAGFGIAAANKKAGIVTIPAFFVSSLFVDTKFSMFQVCCLMSLPQNYATLREKSS